VTYRVAVVATAGNLTLATTDLGAGVLFGLAPSVLQVLRNIVCRDGAAGLDAGWQASLGGRRARSGAVLAGNEARKGRGGDEKGLVQHGVKGA